MILFSDVEGTLYLRDDPEQTKRNLLAVDRWRGGGNLFIVTTGFSLDTLRSLIPDDDLADCYIVNDGCAIMLPQDEEIMSGSFTFISTSDLGENLDINEITKIFPNEEYKIRYYTITEKSYEPLNNPTKLNIWFKNEDAAVKYVSKIRKLDYRALASKGEDDKPELAGFKSKITIMPKMSGKRWAVKSLIKKLGPNAKDIYAIGDGENDIRMLELLGDHGYAIAGSAAAREIHQTTDSLETLVASLLDKH